MLFQIDQSIYEKLGGFIFLLYFFLSFIALCLASLMPVFFSYWSQTKHWVHVIASKEKVAFIREDRTSLGKT